MRWTSPLIVCFFLLCTDLFMEPNEAKIDKSDPDHGLRKQYLLWAKRWKKSDKDNLHGVQERLHIWKENYQFIEDYNRHDRPKTGITLALNQFGDLDTREFESLYTGLRFKGHSVVVKPSKNKPHKYNSLPANFPAEFDWRAMDAVGPVKNQGQCASSWAFAVVGSIESAAQIHNGTDYLVPLSEQNLIDCSDDMETLQGCEGGTLEEAFQSVHNRGGLNSAEQYPYNGTKGFCSFSKSRIVVGLKKTVPIATGNEIFLQNAVLNHGPVAVSLDARGRVFQFYSSGIYYHPECSASELNHAALVVGFGEKDGQQYYIVKNSYGTGWGDQGYMYFIRNKGNHCGIASDAYFPLIQPMQAAQPDDPS